MSDFPDPDEEFELMYGDELELLNELDQEEDYYQPPRKSRKSLDFSTPASSSLGNTNKEQNNVNASQSSNTFEQDFLSLSTQTNVEPPITNSIEPSTSRKRIEQDFLSLSSQTNVEPPITNSIEPSTSRKRTVEDLFGDINDIEDATFEDDFEPRNQKRSKREEDLALIEHILQLRKLSKEKENVTIVKSNGRIISAEHDKYNLSYRVPKYPFIGVTRLDKERVYVRFHSEEYEKEERYRVIGECSFNGVMGDNFKGTWNDARRLLNSQMDLEESNKDNEELSLIEPTDDTKQLWVDLYKPRRYLELLSDESTNRIMLRWMKLWDKVVFNRKPKIKPFIKPDENKKYKFFKQQELNTNLDEHGRPQYKVALLCGPPGLGKTTLAHMVARHAGYNVVEINASDDRSIEAFKTSLENATQMRSVVDQERRPNCLVFDEIDGAPQSSIDYLVKFINGTATTKPKKGKSQNNSILKRPIICICNDVYVPALRPLRQIAFVVNFPQTSSARLAERLMEIARRQCIKTDMGAMLALAEKSNNDIRSCLSVLHFFKVQNKPVRLSDVYRANIGQKDIQKGLFSVWNDIFQIERQKNTDPTYNSKNMQTSKMRMDKILHVISSFGDYERVAQGVFENYPLLKLKDPTLSAISHSLEWFVFSDLLSKQIYTLQNYTLSSYLQYAFVVWHFVFATSQSQKLNYPSAGYEAKMKENRQRALVTEVLRGMQPSIRVHCQRLCLILDILPLLTRIIVPPFRPVSLHLYTKEERDNMLKVVNVMIDYNLNYIQERSPDGTYAYNLEPNVEEIVAFDKGENLKRRVLSYSNKQLIAREIDLEKMRRFEAPKTEENVKKKNAGEKKGLEAKNDSAPLPNHMQTLKAKTVKPVKPAVTKDFFGRVISKASTTGKTATSVTNDIWYQYKEGYNNAVRKKTTISDLK